MWGMNNLICIMAKCNKTLADKCYKILLEIYFLQSLVVITYNEMKC